MVKFEQTGPWRRVFDIIHSEINIPNDIVSDPRYPLVQVSYFPQNDELVSMITVRVYLCTKYVV